MTLRQVGFFRELDHGEPEGPSLSAELGKLRTDPERLAGYLEAASVLAANGPFHDVLSGREFVGGLHIQTDGDFEWPSDLAYYVREYRVGVDEDFVAHCERHGWSPRILTDDELVALSEALLPPHPAEHLPEVEGLFRRTGPDRIDFGDLVATSIGNDGHSSILLLDDGQVVARRTNGPVRWVNSSLDRYRASLLAVRDTPAEDLREALTVIEPEALSTPGTYWEERLG